MAPAAPTPAFTRWRKWPARASGTRTTRRRCNGRSTRSFRRRCESPGSKTSRSIFTPGSRRPGKTYRYLILQSETASPFLRQYVWHVPRALDVAAMATAAAAFRGTHDFSALQSTGGNVTHAIRTVTASSVVVMDR